MSIEFSEEEIKELMLAGAEAFERGKQFEDCPRWGGFINEHWLHGWMCAANTRQMKTSAMMLHWGKIIDGIMREWNFNGDMTKYDDTKAEIEATPYWEGKYK